MYPKELIRYISGNFSSKDEEFVCHWLNEDPARQQELDKLRNLWKISGELNLGDEDLAWKKLKQNAIEGPKNADRSGGIFTQQNRKSHSPLQVLLKVAAVFLVIAGAYGFYIYSDSMPDASQAETKEQIVYQSITSKEGERVEVRLNDGTKVVLNASSEIKYPENYGRSSREIHLKGEAYFEVNNENPLPFIVFTNGTRVEDISTKFNVKAYPNQQETEVIVSEGKVRVSPNTSAEEHEKTLPNETFVLLTQGQKVHVSDNAPHILQVERADLEKALSWLEDRLIFDAEPLSEIIKRLESYYKVEVLVSDPTLLNKRITTSFNKESLENVAKVLAISMETEYSLEGNTLKFFTTNHTPNSNK